MKLRKIDEIHYLRGFSILLIMTGHILYVDTDSSFYLFVETFFPNSTLLFVFISGYLFQYLLVKFSFKQYLVKKVKYVIFPYLIISIPLIAFRILYQPSYLAEVVVNDINTKSYIYQVVFYLTSGLHLVPLWYIPMISIFFVLAPVFKFIDTNPKWYWVLPFLFIASQFVLRDEFEDITRIGEMFLYFLFMYIFGMFISHYKDEVDKILMKHFKWILTGFIITSIVILMDFQWKDYLFYVQKSCLIFVMLNLLSNLQSSRMKKYFSEIANLSFGMYFIHFILILILRMIRMKYFNESLPTSIFEWLLTTILVIVVTYWIVKLIKIIFGKNSRYLIGS